MLLVLGFIGGCQSSHVSSSQVDGPPQQGMKEFANDKEFHAAHTMRDAGHVDLHGKDIEIPVADGKARAYWTAPSEGHKQCVLMVHEWWGLNDNIRETADKLNTEEGYGVLAIDLYDGKVAKNADEAGKYMAAVNDEKASATIEAALKAIESGVEGSAPCTEIGTIGFCFGGGWSHRAAILGGDSVKACVVFYGMPSTSPSDLERLKAPVLFVAAKKDKWINSGVVNGFKTAMDKAGKQFQLEEYDADHAFANPTSQSYDGPASKDAWSKTFAFFKKNLG